MKKSLLLSIAFLILTACQNHSAVTDNNMCTESDNDTLVQCNDHLEDYVPDSMIHDNPQFVHLANCYWQHRFDMADLALNLKSLKVEQDILSAAFDSIHPNVSALNHAQKADSMASILHAFLHVEDCQTDYMFECEAAKELAYNRYRLLSTYDRLLKKDKAIKTEIECWNRFENSLVTYINSYFFILGYGGHCQGADTVSHYNRIITARLASLSDQKSHLGKKKTVSMAVAKKEFVDVINKAYNWLDEDSYTFYDNHNQMDVLKKMPMQKKNPAQKP